MMQPIRKFRTVIVHTSTNVLHRRLFFGFGQGKHLWPLDSYEQHISPDVRVYGWFTGQTLGTSEKSVMFLYRVLNSHPHKHIFCFLKRFLLWCCYLKLLIFLIAFFCCLKAKTRVIRTYLFSPYTKCSFWT